MIVADSSFIYALLDPRDTYHGVAARWYPQNDEELATTPLVLAELDYLAGAHAGYVARDAVRRDVATGAYLVEWWTAAARDAVEIAERYGDLGVSLTDASLVALAARLETRRIATFDERHFRAVRPLHGGGVFTLLPLDA